MVKVTGRNKPAEEARFRLSFDITNEGGTGEGHFTFDLDADQIYRFREGGTNHISDQASAEEAADFLAKWCDETGLAEVILELEVFNWMADNLEIERIN
jgi:hypothetical protein